MDAETRKGYIRHAVTGAILGLVAAVGGSCERAVEMDSESLIATMGLGALTGALVALGAFSARRFRMRGLVLHYVTWAGIGMVGVSGAMLLTEVRSWSDAPANLLFGVWLGGSLGIALAAIERRVRRQAAVTGEATQRAPLPDTEPTGAA